ncbi:MAG: 50S ribosomal protein L11 methyltransferase [Kiritimatiellae bacterium]|nr:50S ribosomal protein L11 methyltransferase [Kiritimatiellia bacterium]
MKAKKTIPVVSATFPESKLGAFLELIDCDLNVTSYTDAETNECHVDLYLNDPSERSSATRALTQTAELLGLKVRPTFTTVAAEDWKTSWRRFFHIDRITKRVVVRPPWEDYTAKEGELVIVIDPGISFGTGKHASTRGCIHYLDRMAARFRGKPVLDLGCGSGILSICARKMRYGEVLGIDNDPDCIPSARKNIARNRVRAEIRLGDLSHPFEPRPVVLANILAPILLEFSANIAASVAPGGILVLSGILATQYPEIKRRYEALGVRETRSRRFGEWKTGLFTKPDRKETR